MGTPLEFRISLPIRHIRHGPTLSFPARQSPRDNMVLPPPSDRCVTS